MKSVTSVHQKFEQKRRQKYNSNVVVCPSTRPRTSVSQSLRSVCSSSVCQLVMSCMFGNRYNWVYSFLIYRKKDQGNFHCWMWWRNYWTIGKSLFTCIPLVLLYTRQGFKHTQGMNSGLYTMATKEWETVTETTETEIVRQTPREREGGGRQTDMQKDRYKKTKIVGETETDGRGEGIYVAGFWTGIVYINHNE